MELKAPIESLENDLDVYDLLIRDIKIHSKGSQSKIESLTKSRLQTQNALEILRGKRVSVCVNCDQEKETHSICRDCLTRIINENKQTEL